MIGNKDSTVFFLLAVFLCVVVFPACKSRETPPEFTRSNTGPFLMKVGHLELIDSLRTDDPVLDSSYKIMILGAESLLDEKFQYVTNKEHLPPGKLPAGATLHDYVSLHRYAYPDSEGNYTIIRDGQTNPEINDYDRAKMEKMSSSVYTLALAFYFTKDERFAQKASNILYNWFLNPETLMNPHLSFAGFRPGVDNSGGGLDVSANDFIKVIEAVSLFYDSSHWTPDLHYELKSWFYEFHSWMQRFPNNAHRYGNVATWADVQRAIFLLFTEQENRLNSNFHLQPVADRIKDQFDPDGTQPYEIRRAISQHYVYYNLKAYMHLGIIRKNQYGRLGYDRDWCVLAGCAGTEEGEPGLRLKASLNDIASSILGTYKATLFESDPGFDRCRYIEVFRPAAIVFENVQYEDTVQQLIKEGCQKPDIFLTYPSLYDF